MSGEKIKSTLDETIGDVRAGQSNYSEEEWRQRLGAFLRANGEEGRIGELKRPAGGASAASIIFSLEKAPTPLRRYVARLKPDHSFWAVFDPVTQFNVQKALNESGLPVPAALWLDRDGKYLGRTGYVMAFAEGIASTPAYYTDGPLSNIDTEKRFHMMRNMIAALANFHDKANREVLSRLVPHGRGASMIECEINMWFDQINHARPELAPLYEPVRHWLADNAPEVHHPVVVHGDYQGSNVLWTGENISAILDFEVVRMGPRESDVAHQCIMDELAARLYGGLDIELPSLTQRAAWYREVSGVELTHLHYHFLRAVFQFACGGVGLTREVKQDLALEPTPFMDYINRRVLGLLPKSLPFEPALPVKR